MHRGDERERRSLTAMPAASFAFKLALAAVSILGYVLLEQAWERLDAAGSSAGSAAWFNHLAGAFFGLLVMAPYVGSRQRVLRVLGFCLAGALIYYAAIYFVVEGPVESSSLVSFLLAGGGAAVASGLAVVAIAPREGSWQLVALTLAAGLLGGAAFELKLSFDPGLVAGHAAWQMLVCVALHVAFEGRRSGAVAR
jgi:membrane associated rhomboid family serine protease